MNEFCIEWLRSGDYAGVTTPSNTALKSKLMRLAKERPDEVKVFIIKSRWVSLFSHSCFLCKSESAAEGIQ